MSGEVLFLVGIISSAVVFLLKELAKNGMQVDLGRGWLTVLLFAVAVPLALWIEPQSLPGLPRISGDLAANIGVITTFGLEIVQKMAAIVGVATSVYNLILKKVYESLARG